MSATRTAAWRIGRRRRGSIRHLAAFLAWFGGTGYLLQHYYSVWFVVALGSVDRSAASAAAAIVFLVSGEGADARAKRRSTPPITT